MSYPDHVTDAIKESMPEIYQALEHAEYLIRDLSDVLSDMAADEAAHHDHPGVYRTPDFIMALYNIADDLEPVTNCLNFWVEDVTS